MNRKFDRFVRSLDLLAAPFRALEWLLGATIGTAIFVIGGLILARHFFRNIHRTHLGIVYDPNLTRARGY